MYRHLSGLTFLSGPTCVSSRRHDLSPSRLKRGLGKPAQNDNENSIKTSLCRCFSTGKMTKHGLIHQFADDFLLERWWKHGLVTGFWRISHCRIRFRPTYIYVGLQFISSGKNVWQRRRRRILLVPAIPSPHIEHTHSMVANRWFYLLLNHGFWVGCIFWGFWGKG